MKAELKNSGRKRRLGKRDFAPGSAFILVVVLTVLLSVIGVMFLMMARVDEIGSSAIAENRDLNAGVDAVVSRIQTVLVKDLLGGDDILLNGAGDGSDAWGGIKGDEDEHYDYPGTNDPWLASLEPELYSDNGTPAIIDDDTYYWPSITDLYGTLEADPNSLYGHRLCW